MKKIFSMALVAVAAATMVSCGNSNPKANLKTSMDTLSYAQGMQYTQGLDQYLQQIGPIDSIYMSEFYKGVAEAFNASEDKKRSAYYLGIQIGCQVIKMYERSNADLTYNDSTEILSKENFLAGFINAASKKNVALTDKQVQAIMAYGNKVAKENYDKMIAEKTKAGNEFMAKKAKEAGVQKLPNGTLYKVVKQGDGPVPTSQAKVRVHYEGKLMDGTVFDSSIKRGPEPVEFQANQVIPGWTEALTHMPKGSKWIIYIPQDQAYGERGAGDLIPPFSPLEFTVELLDVIEPATEEQK